MESIGALIRADRIAQGLSLQGLADALNGDRSLGLDRKITTSWLHHLENGRAKALSTILKKGLARSLHQDESKYLSPNESLAKARSPFAKFFDEQLGSFEQGSTLICDFFVDRERVEDIGELLLCLYQFLVAVDGRIVAFERSAHISLPVLMLAIKSSPAIDDSNPNEIVSKILAPAAAGGFIKCPLPTPTAEALSWVTSRVEVHEQTADEQAQGLLDTEPVCYLGVVSPSGSQGLPVKKLYYYLHPREYGILNDGMADLVYRRFTHYRDLGLYARCDYESSFAFSYVDMGSHYYLDFDRGPALVADPQQSRSS